jgi:F-type H+-transporting ATPase subunit b
MRVWLLMGLSALALVVAAEPCFAADVPGAPRNMFEKALDLGIWTLVVFLVLLFVLSKYAWGPMIAGLDRREQDIASAVEEAKKVKEDARELQQQLAAERLKAGDEIRRTMDEARRAAEQLAETKRNEMLAEIQTERERLNREIRLAKDQAVKEMWDQSAQLASLISAKAIRRQLNADDHRALVDEALAEMNQAVAKRQQALGAGANA